MCVCVCVCVCVSVCVSVCVCVCVEPRFLTFPSLPLTHFIAISFTFCLFSTGAAATVCRIDSKEAVKHPVNPRHTHIAARAD